MDVLLIEGPDGSSTLLAERLDAAGCRVVARLAEAEALESVLEAPSRGMDTAMIVLDLPHPDPTLVERIGEIGRRHERPVAVFVEQTDPEAIRVAVRAGVSSYVVRGAHADRLRDALEVARARFTEERALRGELASVRSSLGDRKEIERAKGRLMKREGLDEQGAYDLLRRMAMRRGCPLVEVARAVLEGLPA